MSYIYVLDWLINKPIKLEIKEDLSFSHGEKLLYKYSDSKDWFVGSYIGYGCDSVKEASFIRKFNQSDELKFQELQKKALDIYPLFREEFCSNFDESVPVTARYDFSGNLVYFYFYAETRFEFGGFIRELRSKVGGNFFLFQIGARDRVRMSEWADNTYGTCGMQLCCKTGKCPLPTVDSDNIGLQNLENRGVEKLKGRCGKLKCCLNYERDVYLKEYENLPRRGEGLKYKGKEYKCCSFNIMSGEIVAKSLKDSEIIKIKMSDLNPTIPDLNPTN